MKDLRASTGRLRRSSRRQRPRARLARHGDFPGDFTNVGTYTIQLTGANPFAVPEASTAMLLGAGIFALLARARRSTG